MTLYPIAYPKESGFRNTTMLRPPQNRDVARPVANLGNTCYMNAVLQALAHAPELCMAMDVAPHHLHCPIYIENAQKRRSSPSSSPDAVSDAPSQLLGTRKSRRYSGKKSPSNQSNSDDDSKFCALCEIEHHLTRVHTNMNNREFCKPVAPTAFVNGFIDRVAPWFKLGQQEDSHEFLRLLIDAMQKSCKEARASPENPQDTPPEIVEKQNSKDVEYPFQLFRGMVESKVSCSYCGSTSSTMDPIEDIGLDVTPLPGSLPAPSSLADVGTALQRFARAEALDSGYKCEKCFKVGSATKESRLASIPPILTLHLKRFRYGETPSAALASSGQSTRRSGRSSEVSQLLSSGNGDFFGGKSGSAKIEGHSKFEQILDLKPYLTEEMQRKHSKMFCRLFAVIVHAGKNSHSGHYISYVRNIAKNEWWKMDDARITLASVSEVMSAEAYMLFYRVVEHPFAIRLRVEEQKLQEAWTKEALEEAQSSSRNTPASVESLLKEDASETTPRTDPAKAEENASVAASSLVSSVRTSSSRKRKAPNFVNGEEWARERTTLPKQVRSRFQEIEQTISEYVRFKPEFFKLLTEQANKRGAKIGHGPSSGVCEEDVVDGAARIKRALLEVFYELDQAQSSFFKTAKASGEALRGVLASSARVVDADEDTFL